MKIAYCLPEGHGEISGGNTLNRLIINGLRDQGFVVEIFTPAIFGLLEKTADNFGAIIQDGILFKSFVDLNPSLRTKTRVLGFCHAPLSHIGENDDCDAEIRYYRSVCSVIYPSRALAELGRQYLGLDPERQVILSPARVYEAQVRKNHPPMKCLNLLCVGRLDPNKNQRGLLQQLRSLQRRRPKIPWQLTIVGNLSFCKQYAEEVQKEAQIFGNKVLFFSEVSSEKVQELYAASNVLIVASKYESLSLVTLEAFAYGLAVVSWSRGGLRELVRKGGGVLLDAPSDLEKTMTELWYNRRRFRRLQAKAWTMASRLPTWCEESKKIGGFIRCPERARFAE